MNVYFMCPCILLHNMLHCSSSTRNDEVVRQRQKDGKQVRLKKEWVIKENKMCAWEIFGERKGARNSSDQMCCNGFCSLSWTHCNKHRSTDTSDSRLGCDLKIKCVLQTDTYIYFMMAVLQAGYQTARWHPFITIKVVICQCSFLSLCSLHMLLSLSLSILPQTLPWDDVMNIKKAFLDSGFYKFYNYSIKKIIPEIIDLYAAPYVLWTVSLYDGGLWGNCIFGLGIF